MQNAFVHPTAIVETGATLGKDCKVWHFCHVRTGAKLEDNVSLARDVYVDKDVTLGKGSRVQNGVSLYTGLEIGQWCFIGPHATFTNDSRPRSGKIAWTLKPTKLGNGMSIGAGAFAGPAVNGRLVEEEFDLAVAEVWS